MLPTTLPTFHLRAVDRNSIGVECRKWIQCFENFLIAFEVTDNARKKALLLHYANDEVHELISSLPDAANHSTTSPIQVERNAASSASVTAAGA